MRDLLNPINVKAKLNNMDSVSSQIDSSLTLLQCEVLIFIASQQYCKTVYWSMLKGAYYCQR